MTVAYYIKFVYTNIPNKLTITFERYGQIKICILTNSEPQLIQASRETRNRLVRKGGFHYTTRKRIRTKDEITRFFERGGFVHVLTRRFRVVACRGRAHLSTSPHQRCARVKCRLTKCCSRLEIPSICIRATMYPATRGNNGSGGLCLISQRRGSVYGIYWIRGNRAFRTTWVETG